MLTPPRYLYTHTETYLKHATWTQIPGLSWLTKKAMAYLRWWDGAAAHRPDKIIAISRRIQQRIANTYHLKSECIYPAIPDLPDAQKIATLHTPFPFLLSLSRLVTYKRIDLSITASIRCKKNLVIAGEGEDKHRLIALAGKKAYVRTHQPLIPFLQNTLSQEGRIIFVGHVTNTERLQLLTSATALLMPGLEDFGITALEAAALGTPSVLHRESGVSEILKDSQSALHSAAETSDAVIQALSRLDKHSWQKDTLQQAAKICSTEVVTSKIKEYVYDSIIQLKQTAKNNGTSK